MWNTTSEIAFLDGLGEWRDRGKGTLRARDKVDLLKSYREGVARRTDWGDMDRAEILKHVDEQIMLYSAMHPDAII